MVTSGEYEGEEYIHHMTMADMKIIAMTENTTHAIPIIEMNYC